MDIVDRIFLLVDKRYPEQRQFAEDLGIPAPRISEWRKRKSTSYNKRLPQIATVLNTSVEYLLTGNEKTPTGQEADGLRKYDMLNDENRAAIDALIDRLLASQSGE